MRFQKKKNKVKVQKNGFFTKKKLLPFMGIFGVIGILMVFQLFAYVPPTLAGNDGEFHPLNPARIMDSRNGTGTKKAALKGGETRTLVVRGKGGVGGKAKAAVLNFTVTQTQGPGHLTAWPSDAKRPVASVINFSKSQTIANNTYLGLSADGKIKIRNGSKQTVHVIVDVNGYFVNASGANGLRYSGANSRILDTRFGIGARKAKLGAKKSLVLKISNAKNYTDAEAVTGTVTVVNPTKPGHLTLYPRGKKKPSASNINFAAKQVIANSAVVKMSSSDEIVIYNGSSGSVNVIFDVTGFFGDRNTVFGSGLENSGRFVAVNPVRAIDTRSGTGLRNKLGSDNRSQYEFFWGGKFGLPRTGKGAGKSLGAVVVNNVAVQPTANGNLSMGVTTKTSVLNYAKNQVIAATTVAPVEQYEYSGGYGRTLLTIPFSQETHLITDLTGYFYL